MNQSMFTTNKNPVKEVVDGRTLKLGDSNFTKFPRRCYDV